MSAKANYSICTPKDAGLALSLSRCKHVCRYHKLPRRTRYDSQTLAPKNMCIDLFNSAYPFCLAQLYGAKMRGGNFSGNIVISCPNPDSNVAIKIKAKPTITRYLTRSAIWLASIIGYDIEIPDTQITMTILEDANPSCIYRYKKGDSFRFNIWQGRELCPATFDSVYPSVHNLTRGGSVPWSPGTSLGEVVCPDPKSSITLAISRKKRK
jgi:uncharacterized repeat protein (TIGR04076 family)